MSSHIPLTRSLRPPAGDLFGHRIVGSANLETSIDWVRDRLIADGFSNVHKEPATVKVWQRGEESCTLTAPLVGDQASYDVAILGLGGSVGVSPLRKPPVACDR